MKPESIVNDYFSSWRTNDPEKVEALFSEDISVRGPLGLIEGAKAYRNALEWLFGITKELVIVKQWVDGPDVLTWFEIQHSESNELISGVNWLKVENNLISQVRVAFDPRPILPPENV
ncbi:nuclear transport factor 2 family protein [Bacillus mesophilum]|uniref:Nuclear transport factor 2 family protein n=1 Tax=Bacillus mesophilum TaxID=1071718 RepID=A0A7V7RKB2_9BACI|nr:nuclear transport factor 2 family protein [Bacillus mesophilum]KAB2331711.1 nuclear transport factor 2 family protein [Bacillus mesophilum]